MKKEPSKELKAINDALIAYYRKHGGNVCITCDVIAFDDNDDVVDDMFWIVGYKPTLELMAEQLTENIENDIYDEEWY